MLKGKHVVIGVTGGIAVYKVLDVISRLKKLHCDVSVIMTKNATEFVSELSFSSLSLNKVVVDTFERVTDYNVEHIELAKRGDLFLVAPATYNIIGKMANGIADDMLSTVLAATKVPVYIAPAMNTGMYTNPILERNMKFLKELGYHFIEPDAGRLACGDVGKGKLASPEKIVDTIIYALSKKDLEGKKILITAGPTRENIDPVRFITNHSSGKMGYALALEARNRGAEVTLVSGVVHLDKIEGIHTVDVITSEDMYNEVISRMDDMDIIIKSAAVSDYRPKDVSEHKLKKSDEDMSISLERTKDIAYEIGQRKNNQIIVGFAAETENLIENAKKKIEKKKFDFIIANNIKLEGAGFNSDTNIVSIIDKKGNMTTYDKMLKSELAGHILDIIKKA